MFTYADASVVVPILQPLPPPLNKTITFTFCQQENDFLFWMRCITGESIVLAAQCQSQTKIFLSFLCCFGFCFAIKS